MIKSVKKAVSILQVLSNNPEKAVPLNELAKLVELNKSTCSHILDTLCESLLVERVSRKTGYRLGAGTYMLTRYGGYQKSLTEIAAPVIRWLGSQIDGTVFLTVVCDGTKYIIFHVESEGDNALSIGNSEIIQGHIDTTATGLLMMAYMDTDSLNRVIMRQNSEFSNLKGISISELENKLRNIRSSGHAHVYDDENNTVAYAFRVFDGERTVAAVGVLYSILNDSKSIQEAVIKYGSIAANEIGRRLRFGGSTSN